MTETLGAIWDLTSDLIIRIEAVHRLSILGAVVTHVQHGTSQEGFDAEWRMIQLLNVDSDRIDSNEIFDEADLDAALARFDELHSHARPPENAVSHVDQRFWTYFTARDWDGIAELLAEDIATDDRRRVVNAGVRHGRDSHITEMRAVAEVGVERITSTIVATRGSRLALTRICGSTLEIGTGELSAEVLNVVEIDAGNHISARVGFDADDIAAAVAELDARYLAGEAAPHAKTWTAVVGAYLAFNRHEIPSVPDWVNVDHRRGTTVGPGDMAANIQATWDVAPNIRRSIEAVHRLDQLGVVVTHTAYGTSQEGFDAEWRLVALLMFEGDLISRAELFDEADLDAALARFDELQPQARRLENAATRLLTRYLEKQLARDWDAMAEMLTDDYQNDDRRHVVSSGAYGREGEIANARASADLGVEDVTATVIATRGERLYLSRFRYSGRDHGLETFVVELLVVGESNVDGRGAATVGYDLEDVDAAFAEVDARYLTGEAADHAEIWSAMTQAYAAINRHELPPTTPDWVNIDHRRALAFVPGDLPAYLNATWELAPDFSVYVEAVHRLSNLGGVVTHCARGSSQDGFDAEWREVTLLIFKGDLISRAEFFEEAELEAALARFDELN
jgi:hypothetical protein